MTGVQTCALPISKHPNQKRRRRQKLKRPVSRTQWTALGVSYLGVILVYLHDLDGSLQVNVPLGSALVLGSCLSYSFYLVGAGEMVRRLGPMRLTAWASLVACVLCVTQALLVGGGDIFRLTVSQPSVPAIVACVKPKT